MTAGPGVDCPTEVRKSSDNHYTIVPTDIDHIRQFKEDSQLYWRLKFLISFFIFILNIQLCQVFDFRILK